MLTARKHFPDDPAFAAIARHRSALTYFVAQIPRADFVVAKEQGREVEQSDLDACDAAMKAEEDALAKALASATTVAGLREMLKYLAGLEGGAVPEDPREAASLMLKSPVLAA